MKKHPASLVTGASLALAAVLSLAACDMGPSDPVEAARVALSQGEPRTAMDYIVEALSEKPDDIEAKLVLAEAAMALGIPERAVTELETIPEKVTMADKVNARLADAYLAEGRFEKAQAALDKIETQSALSQAVQVQVLKAQGDLSGSDDRLQAALKTFPDDGRLTTLDAERLWQQAKQQEAVERLADALNQDRPVPEAYLLAGQMSLAQRQLEPAKQSFETLLKWRPTHQGAMLALAAIAKDQGDIETAENWIAKTNSVGPVHPVAVLFASQIALDQGDAQRAYELIETVPNEYFKEPQFARLRGFIAAARKQPATAIAFLEDYAEAGNPDILARRVLAENLAGQGDYDKAWTVIAPAVDSPQADVGLLTIALAISQKSGRGDSASIRAMIQKRAAAASLSQPLRKAGEAIRAGDWAAADKIYAPLIDGTGKTDPALLNNAASVKTELGEHKAAVALARRALKQAPESPQILDTLGWALWNQGDSKGEARKVLTKARAAAPSNPVINQHWAIAHAR